MSIKLVDKKLVNFGKFEIEVNNKVYYIYHLYDKSNIIISKFYITNKDEEVIILCDTVDWNDIQLSSFEKYISENINKWVYKFEPPF